MEEKQREKSGHLHPLTQIINEVVEVFRPEGFVVAEGPEIETEFFNFDSLNVPADHPSRDMQDTFWLKGEKNLLLRTQTSAVQTRVLKKMVEEGKEPPVRILVPGKVFRNEATDARHEAQFFQIEGLVVDRDVRVSHLIGYLNLLFRKLFGEKVEVRLRPSFFPFVEPGFEVDMKCPKCSVEKQASPQCSLCGNSGWLEIGGAGMVHPHVFEAVGLDGGVWQGFAFGMGAERLAMLRWGIKDLRLFAESDWRFIRQF